MVLLSFKRGNKTSYDSVTYAKRLFPNYICMEFGVHHIIGLKVICTIEDNMLKLTLLNLAMKILPAVYPKARL